MPDELRVEPDASGGPNGTRSSFGWGGSLHTSFRLFPEPVDHLRVFLNSEGKTEDEVLNALPYHRARAGIRAGARPDRKRYRDPRQVYQTVGLLYEDKQRGGAPVIRLTELGRTVRRWLPILNEKNAPILGRYAAYALAACQLSNPISVTGRRMGADVKVHPFAFIWRAMLALDGKISSDELNRAVFRVRNEEDLEEAVDRIRLYRRGRLRLQEIGAETITGPRKNDRVIPWIAAASFGWLLIADKRRGEVTGYYHIPESMMPLLTEAAYVRHRHREFSSIPDYVEHISRAAGLPQDLR